MLSGLKVKLIAFAEYLHPGRLTGPIFEKELRVSSRMKRHYTLRFAYIGLLVTMLIVNWQNVTHPEYWSVSSLTQISSNCRTLVQIIVQFQYVASIVIAVVLLSTSISDETNKRSLGILMTTPITSAQIVIGKLASKLVHIFLILAVSMPLLSVLRIFRGVSMEYLILSLCITLSSVVLAGSLSLYFSINSKKAYEAVFRTLFVLAVIYIFIPIYLVACSLIYDMIESNSGHIRIHEILITISIAIAPILIVGIYGIIYYIRNYEKYTSPLLSIGGILFLTVLVIISHVAILYMFIIDETGIIFMIGVYYNPLILMIMIIDPFSIASGNIASYYTVLINCAISLALSGILMSISIAKVRKRALENILKTNAVRKNDYDDKIELNKHTNEKIRRVDKDPVVWKESCTPMIEGGNRTRKIIISFVVAALLFVYSLGMSTKTMVYNTSHITIITMYVCLGILWCAVVSAISLTTEKEKQCMPLLLTTLITDMNIIKGKIIGCLRRSIVIWSLLYAHLIIFIYGGIIHIIALPLMSIVIIWTLAFTISLGIYLSTIYKKSTTAIMSCIFIIAVLWLAPRIATQYARNIDHRNYIVAICKIMNPIDQTIQIMGKTSGKNNVEKDINNILNDPPKNGIHTFKTTIYIILLISVIYMIVSVLQTWKAMNNIRKKIE